MDIFCEFVNVSDVLPCGSRLLLRCGDRFRWAGSKDGGHWSCVLNNMGTRDRRSLVDQWESNRRHSGRNSCSSWYWKLWNTLKHWDCNGIIRNKPSPVQDFATIHSIYSISLVWERYVWCEHRNNTSLWEELWVLRIESAQPIGDSMREQSLQISSHKHRIRSILTDRDPGSGDSTKILIDYYPLVN